MRGLIAVAGTLTLAFALAACGGSSSSPATVTVTAASSASASAGPARISFAQMRSALRRYGVTTKSIGSGSEDGCQRMAARTDSVMVKTYYEAWIVVSPTPLCDAALDSEKPANAQRADRNVWIEWGDGDSDSSARPLVTAFALAAIVKSNL